MISMQSMRRVLFRFGLEEEAQITYGRRAPAVYDTLRRVGDFDALRRCQYGRPPTVRDAEIAYDASL